MVGLFVPIAAFPGIHGAAAGTTARYKLNPILALSFLSIMPAAAQNIETFYH